MFCVRLATGGSYSWVRGKSGAGECEYASDVATALVFATEQEARAYVAGEKRKHSVVEFASGAAIGRGAYAATAI